MKRTVLLCACLVGALLLSGQVSRAHMPPSAHRTARVQGLELAYLDEGQGPLVVLVHGFPDTPVTWDDVRPRLVAEGFRVVTPWLRGYAPSAVPSAPVTSSEDIGRDVLGLIDAVGAQSAVVVGHDWGAAAAYAAATLAPEKVSRLVTIAIPHPGTLKPTLAQAWRGRHFLYLSGKRGVHRMGKDHLAHVDELYARWAPSWEPPRIVIAAAKQSLSQPGSLDAALGYYRGARTKEALFDAPIKVPTLAVCGEADGFTPEDFARAASAFSGPYRYQCLPGEHWPHRQSPEAFWALLRDFLKAAP